MIRIEQWLKIDPLDTLFFRGGEPMDMGETHDTGKPLFPPMPATIVGALRTAILIQKRISLKKIDQLGDNEGLDDQNLPFWGTPTRSGFGIAGPLLMANDVLLFPAPACWFYTKNEAARIKFYEAQPVDKKNLPVITCKEKLFWIENPPDGAKSMAGNYWVTGKALKDGVKTIEEVKEIEKLSDAKAQAVYIKNLICFEKRVGIARDNTLRTAKDGHLYSSSHIRLRPGVSLVIGIDKPLCPSHLDKTGIFQLGGEGRLVKYKLIEPAPELPSNSGSRWLLVSPVSWSTAKQCNLLDAPYISGKLFRAGGWDMRKSFHKPSETYFPVGTVFFTGNNPGLTELIPF